MGLTTVSITSRLDWRDEPGAGWEGGPRGTEGAGRAAMFGGKKLAYELFDEVAFLKGPPQRAIVAKADYAPSHAGTVGMTKGEPVQKLGNAPGASGKDWTKVKLRSGVEGFVPTAFLAESVGPPQLLAGRLQLARTELKFEGDTGGMAGLIIKVPMEGVVSCAVDPLAEDIVRASGPLKTLKVGYHEKGYQKGDRRDIEVLLPAEHAGKLERGMPELQKAAQEEAAAPQGSWSERMAAKKEEMRTAALNAAINTAGALISAQEALESTGVGMALKNFGVADEYIEEEKRDFEPGERVESMAGDQGVVTEANFVEAREAVMVKVKLDGGRVRTYFENDIRRVAQAIFGPEPVKIKSLSKSAKTDDISLQLESAKISIDAEVMKFNTDDGWTEATIFLRDITDAVLDPKATFQYTDPVLATTNTLTALMFESKTANLQLLVTEDRGRAIIAAIDTARQTNMAANRERLAKKREKEQQAGGPAAAAPAAGGTQPDLSLAPADGAASGSAGGWDADSMAVPAGWPPTGAAPAPAAAREADSPGAFGGGGGWGDAVSDAFGGAEPAPAPAVSGFVSGFDFLGGAAAAPAPSGIDLLGGAPAAAAAPSFDLLGGNGAAGGMAAAAPSFDLLGGGGLGGGMGGAQLDANMFATDPEPEADASPAVSGGDGWGADATAIPEGWATVPDAAAAAPAPGPAAAGGGGGDGWGADAMAIPEGWPTQPDTAAAPAPAPPAGGDGWGADAMAIPAGWPVVEPTPAPAPAPAPAVDGGDGWGADATAIPEGWPTLPDADAAAPAPAAALDLLGAFGAAAAPGINLLGAPALAPAATGGFDLLGGSAPAAVTTPPVDLLGGGGGLMGGGGMMGGAMDASMFTLDPEPEPAA